MGEYERIVDALFNKEKLQKDITIIADTQLELFEKMLPLQKEALVKMGKMYDSIETKSGKSLLVETNNQLYTLIGQTEEGIKNIKEMKEVYGRL